MARIRILSVGLDPMRIDFSDPGAHTVAGVDAERVIRGLHANKALLSGLGFDFDICLLDYGDTAEPMLRRTLTETTYDCILVGAGIRLIPDNTALFETLMNVIHRTAPDATLVSTPIPAIRLPRCSVGSLSPVRVAANVPSSVYRRHPQDIAVTVSGR
jgi:hypothetical protein